MNKNLKMSFISGVIYATFMSMWFYFTGFKNLLIIYAGCFFIWFILIFAFVSFQTRKLDKVAQDIEGKILYKGLANHFVNIESIGGYIFITNDKIIFKSHSFNIQNHTTEIFIEDITEIRTYNNLGIIPNGLKIVHNGNIDRFVVNNRKQILELLKHI